MDAFFEEQMKRLEEIFAPLNKLTDECIEAVKKMETDVSDINLMLAEVEKNLC